ncbi:Rdx family protein [Halovenus halobia]|uniref:Rdx family protein n=1 Tax=Halovenus halobia TaxID=3396622 RepID=UPI003F549863
MNVEIDCCEGCGGLGMAVEVRDALESDCGEVLDGVELTPVDDGSVRVFVDRHEVFTTDAAESNPTRVTHIRPQKRGSVTCRGRCRR